MAFNQSLFTDLCSHSVQNKTDEKKIKTSNHSDRSWQKKVDLLIQFKNIVLFFCVRGMPEKNQNV